MGEQHRHRRRSQLPGLCPVPPSVYMLSVIELHWVAGEGCCEEDPARFVKSYYDASTGTHLFTKDPFQDKEEA